MAHAGAGARASSGARTQSHAGPEQRRRRERRIRLGVSRGWPREGSASSDTLLLLPQSKGPCPCRVRGGDM